MVFDLLREDILSTIGDDNALSPSCEIQVVVLVFVSDISGVEPSIIGKDLFRRFLIVVVALHHHRSFDVDRAVSIIIGVYYLDLAFRNRLTHRALNVCICWIEMGDRACLSQSITLHEIYSQLIEHLECGGRKRTSSADADPVVLKAQVL